MSRIAHQAAPSFNRLRTKATLLRSVGNSTGLFTMNNSHWIVKVRNWSCAPLNFSSRLPGDQSNSGCGATCGATPSWGKLCPRCCVRCIMALCRFVISIYSWCWCCNNASATCSADKLLQGSVVIFQVLKASSDASLLKDKIVVNALR